MLNTFIKLLNDRAVINTVIVSISVVLSSIFAYVLQFFLGRFLPVSVFGEFGALLSVAYIVGVPASVFGIVLTKKVSELSASDPEKIKSFIQGVSFYSILLGVGLSLIFMIFGPILKAHLKLSDEIAFAAFTVSIGFSFFSLVAPSFLQGLQRFKLYSVFLLIYAALRTGFPILFVLIGMSLTGVFGGFAVAAFVSYFLALIFLKYPLNLSPRNEFKPVYVDLLKFALPVLFVNFGLIALNNLDVILVKKYFDSISAGYYAGLVTVGKVLLFGAGTVGTVMFPIITAEFTKRTLSLKKFLMFFFMQLAVVLIGILVFSLIPQIIVGVMFGSKFAPTVAYLPLFSIFVGLYVLVNFMVLFYLSINRTSVAIVQLPFLLVQYLLLNLYNDSLYTVILVNIGVTGALLAGLFLYGFREYKLWKKQTNS